MKLPRRRFLHLTAAGVVTLPAALRTAWAQTYPSRPVRLIVGFAAGQAIDITTRTELGGPHYFRDLCRLREPLTALVMISLNLLPKAAISIDAGSMLFTSKRTDSS
jgi:hypothetical protein